MLKHPIIRSACRQFSCTLLSCTLFACVLTAPLHADTPAASSANAVKPSNLVFHGVFVQSQIDDEKSFLKLKGPRFVSKPAVRTWYEIYKPPPRPSTLVKVADPVNQTQAIEMMVSTPSFFATTAKRLTSGTPQKTSQDDRNLYVAYQIDSISTVQRSFKQPVFLAVPAQEWHHDEHFEVNHPDRWLLIEEQAVSNNEKTSESISILDQFGLNRLQPESASWVVHPVSPYESL